MVARLDKRFVVQADCKHDCDENDESASELRRVLRQQRDED